MNSVSRKRNSSVQFSTLAKEKISDLLVLQLNFSTSDNSEHRNYFFNLRRQVLSKDNKLVFSRNGLCFNKTYAEFILSAREVFTLSFELGTPAFSKNNALASQDNKFILFNSEPSKICIGKKQSDESGTFTTLTIAEWNCLLLQIQSFSTLIPRQ